MFNFLKNKLSTIYNQVSSKMQTIFRRPVLDADLLQELERILITADTGVLLTRRIITHLSAAYARGEITQGIELKAALSEQLLAFLMSPPRPSDYEIFLLVGVNGSGKTTFAGKLAYYLGHQEGRNSILVAADTFRAAATEQLASWAAQANSPLIAGREGQDPASVVFEACQQFKQQSAGALIIDTAGRLQTKTHLMK
jgi:fused signal recognition particle receptor